MSKLHWDAEIVFNLPGMPDRVNYAAIDEDRTAFFFEDNPKIRICSWASENWEKFPLETDYEGDWKDSLLIRPGRLKVGDFCKFWDDDEEPEDHEPDSCYGYLNGIITNDEYCFTDNRNQNWAHARKFTPRGE